MPNLRIPTQSIDQAIHLDVDSTVHNIETPLDA
jgi:hypothetical protein